MANSLVPNFEVKLFLKASEVLKSDHKLKDAVKSVFSLTGGTKKMSIQFVDTEKQDFYKKGWNLRVRKKEGDRDFELTYKRRYTISEDVSITAEGKVDGAVEAARGEGFDLTTKFDAQVQVGYQKQTLSISHEKKVPDTGFGEMDLPQAEDSRGFLIAQAHDKFKSMFTGKWGDGLLNDSKVYGPVHAKRSKGNWEGFELFLEVWPIRKSTEDASLEPIVEASFKANNMKQALEGKAKLEKTLETEGWFLPEDSLKTKLVMDRY